MTDEQHVRDVWAGYGRAIQAMDLPALQELWDAESEHLLYQPEEYAQPCRTWEDLVSYWRGIPEVVEHIVDWRELETDIAVSGDVALVFSRLWTSFQLKGATEALSGEVRFTLGLRRTANGWRLVHAHESRQLIVE